MKRVEELEAQLLKMEAKLQKLTPKNSSIPPSTQHPHAKEPKPKKPKATSKKYVGQPGHAQATRPLIPTEECDEVKPLYPKHCCRCKRPLKGKDHKPLRHQVIELSEVYN